MDEGLREKIIKTSLSLLMDDPKNAATFRDAELAKQKAGLPKASVTVPVKGRRIFFQASESADIRT